MKSIELLNLKLVNFKGIKEFELNAAGSDIKVFGDNATGKTTLFDAFVWLLFNKDSNNRSDFDIKTLDKAGNVINKLDHEVEATLLIDERQLVLRKVYFEKWTKKKGSITSSFTGHKTDYYMNGVPSNKKDFDESIKDVVEEEVFKLLTSPNYFNESIHWKDRRSLLLEVAGEVTDEDVIASDPKLSKLLEVLNGNSIEDHKKIIASKRRDINKEIERIPIRIDEINRNMPIVSDSDETKIKEKMESLLNEIDQKHEQINSINNGSEVNELKKQISDIELQISNVRNDHTQNEQNELFKLKTRLQEEQSNLTIMRNNLSNKNDQFKSNESRIKEYQSQMERLRQEGTDNAQYYKDQNELAFDHENNCVCPTCEQDMPEEKVEEAVSNFNRNKSKLLEQIVKRQEEINSNGKELKEKVAAVDEENEMIQKEIDKVTEQGLQKAKEIKKIEANIEETQKEVKPIEGNEEYIKLNDKKKTLQEKTTKLEQSVSESVSKAQAEVLALKEQQNELQVDLNTIKQTEQSKARIEELEAQERKLAAEFEELEHQLHLTEEFTRTKVNMLTENINKKFKYARFNLFKENLNGGLEEICDTTFDGVPYGSGLNNAARINVGLDIIRTLSEHYGVQAPIFVDNAESITQLIDIDSQIISLVVSEGDKELRVEGKLENESEVA